ncbi:hypothetical protein RYX36_026655, partial [Vicia faba]
TTKGIAAQAQASMHLAESSFNKDIHVDLNLESFSITDELREFIREITVTTFRDFPLQEVKEMKKETKTSNSSRLQDLDAFLLGDTEDGDDDP